MNNKQLREQLLAAWELLSFTRARHKQKIRRLAKAYRRIARIVGGNRAINKILLEQNRDLRQKVREFYHRGAKGTEKGKEEGKVSKMCSGECCAACEDVEVCEDAFSSHSPCEDCRLQIIGDCQAYTDYTNGMEPMPAKKENQVNEITPECRKVIDGWLDNFDGEDATIKNGVKLVIEKLAAARAEIKRLKGAIENVCERVTDKDGNFCIAKCGCMDCCTCCVKLFEVIGGE